MSRRQSMLVSSFIALGSLPVIAAAAAPSHYDAEVQFVWDRGAPSRIMEDDPVHGQTELKPVPNPVVWKTTQRPGSVLTLIHLLSSDVDYTFPFRSFRGADTPVVHVAIPAFTCASTDIDAMNRSLKMSREAQIEAMLASGWLLNEPLALCPKTSRARLMDLYYKLICNLSSTTAYVGYLESAETYYKERWSNSPESLRTIADCRQRSENQYVVAMARATSEFVRNENFDAALALNADVNELRGDAEWATVLASYPVTATDIQAWEIRASLARQFAAQQRGDWDEAKAENGQLLLWSNEPERQQAFDRAQIDVKRVQSDATSISRSEAVARISAAAAPPPRE